MSTVAGDPPSPPPPPAPATLLSTCMEPTTHLALTTITDLDPSYISTLLQHDPINGSNHSISETAVFGRGIPLYPLYKCLAAAVEHCMVGREFVGVEEGVVVKWREWVSEAGIQLKKMLEEVEFELHVQEPFFSQLRAGQKTVEGRCATGNYTGISPESVLLFNKCLLLKVQHVKWYSSFAEMLEIETLENVLPGVSSIEEGVQIYRNFYSEEKEMSNGVLAISVAKPATQPYNLMANLLSRLSYDGIGHLLGMKHTVGTVPDALPPPRSSLISSSMKPHRPNVVP